MEGLENRIVRNMLCFLNDLVVKNSSVSSCILKKLHTPGQGEGGGTPGDTPTGSVGVASVDLV